MRKKIKQDKIFIYTSILFIIILFIIYGYRFIHYYRLEHKNTDNNTQISEPISIYNHLLTYLTSEEDKLSGITSPLVKNELTNEYYFKGQVTNNYIHYSGRLWRIVKIDENNNITLITEEIQTLLPYGEEANYKTSYINNYLNDIDTYSIFYNTLNNKEVLKNTIYCEDKIEEIDNITCNTKNSEYKLTLLSLNDYLNSGANEGYLNINEYFWLMDFDNTNKLYYVFDKGGINKTEKYNTNHYGIRPVITIDGELLLTSGDGTIENPYLIDEYKDYKLINVGVGEYVEYSNKIWRIISKQDTSVKVILEDYIEEDDIDKESIFSKKNNTFDIKDKDSIAYYLNNDYYNILENKEYLVKGPFYIGKYKTDTYDYRLIYNNKIETYIGLPQIGDLYINTHSNILTSLGIEDHMNNILYVIEENNNLYASKINDTKKIRPVIYLDGNLIALSGEGTNDSPYIIGR